MKNIIAQLHEDHVVIDSFMKKLESAIADSDFMKSLFALEDEFVEFSKVTLNDHHIKEEEFIYRWMIDQNKNSDKILIRRMIEDHKKFEEKAQWIIEELNLAKDNFYKSHANFCYEISLFVRNYEEHLLKENNFIFLIAENLEKKAKT